MEGSCQSGAVRFEAPEPTHVVACDWSFSQTIAGYDIRMMQGLDRSKLHIEQFDGERY